MSNELQQVNPGAMVSMIERLAANKDVDVEKLERLLAMQERVLTRQGEMAFNEAMKLCQEEMPAILRNKSNQQTNSRYADLEAVNDAIVPVYTRHGFSLSFGTADCPLPEHYRVTCLVSHTGGHTRSYQGDIPIDAAGMKGVANKTKTHAFGSTMSYGRRYVTLMIFNVTLTNEDNDGQQRRESNSARSGMPPADLETRHALEEICTEATTMLNAGDPAGALKFINSKDLGAEDKTDLWSMFDSKQRSAMKKAGQVAAKPAEPAPEATEPF